MNKAKIASNRKSQPTAPIIFALFVFIALTTVIALEYNDYRHQRYSFLFTQVFKLEGTAPQRKQFGVDVEALLKAARAEYDYVTDTHGIIHFRIRTGEDQFRPLMASLDRTAKKYHAALELTDTQEQKDKSLYLYQVHFRNRLTYLLLVSKIAASAALPEKKEIARTTPRIAVIIDDIGYNPLTADELKGLGIPVTASVIPNAPYAESEAQSLRRFGIETIIHLPMQSKNAENNHTDVQLITRDSTPPEIAAFIKKAKTVVPAARGANNHMGSYITSDRELTARVLKILRDEHLFFIDSRTAPRSIAYDMAREMHMKTYFRSVFLDDVQDYAHTLGQIRRLVTTARGSGKALGIGHPFESTFAALRDSVVWLRQQNLSIVFASDLLE